MHTFSKTRCHVCLLLLSAVLALQTPAHADPTPETLLRELDALLAEARTDVTAFDRWQEKWDALSPETQAAIKALEAREESAAWRMLEDGDAGARWAAETGALLDSIAYEQPAVALTPSALAEAELAALETELASVEAALKIAMAKYAEFSSLLRSLNAGEIVVLDSEELRSAGLTAKGFLRESLTDAYIEVNQLTQRHTVLQAAVDAQRDVVHAELAKASAEARFQAAFNQAQLISQHTAKMLEGLLAFSEARTELESRIAQASDDGRESAAEQWRVDLQTLAEIVEGWTRVQQSLIAALVAEQNRNFAANQADGLGPADNSALLNGIVERGLTVETDKAAIAAVRQQVARLVGGAHRTDGPLVTLNDVLLEYSDTVDEAIVTPVELVTEPVESLSGNFRFWRRYAAYGYGVGYAAVTGVQDIAVLAIEAVDLTMELNQSAFNIAFQTDIDWFGSENIEFFSGIASNLSAEQVQTITSAVLTELDRRIARNAARGEAGIRDALSDTGIAVGTVAGAEEGLIRVAVIATRHGKVLVRGAKVDEFLASARIDPAALASGRVQVDDAAALASDAAALADDAASLPLPTHVEVGTSSALTTRDYVPGPPPALDNALINAPESVSGFVSSWRPPGAPELEFVQITAGNDVLTLPVGQARRGSSSHVWVNPNDGSEVVKLTRNTATGGLHADNYANKLLAKLRDSGVLDRSKVHVLEVKRQALLSNGSVVTIMERAPDDIRTLMKAQNGVLLPEQISAIVDGVLELARHNIVLPDGKLDNLALLAKPDGSWVLVPLDVGGGMVMKSPDAAARFMRALYAPPPEMVRAIESMPLQKYIDELKANSTFKDVMGRVREAEDWEIEAAIALLADMDVTSVGYYQNAADLGNSASDVSRLAAEIFHWARIHEHKRLLAEAYDGLADFDHLRRSSGLDIRTFGPGRHGVTFNPAGGRQSEALRVAMGGDPNAPTGVAHGANAMPEPIRIPDGDSELSVPFVLVDDSVASAAVSVAQDAAESVRKLNELSAPAREGSSLIAYVRAEMLKDFTKRIAPLPFIARRMPIIAKRLVDYLDTEPVEFSADLDMDALFTQVSGLPGVMSTEPNSERIQQNVLPDPMLNDAQPAQWGMQRVGLDAEAVRAIAGDTAYASVVAVIDTGVAWSHPDLNALDLWVNARELPDNGLDDDHNGYVDDIIGWNFVDDNNLPWDTDGHGTMVAGIVAAQSDNGIGIAGVNPHARIMVLRALDARGRGNAFSIAEAIFYAAAHGADVINLSLGGAALTQVERQAVEYARSTGCVVVVAAGNEGNALEDYGPAMAPGAIVVASIDQQDEIAAESNWGDIVSLAAPGVDVVSLRAPGSNLLEKYLGAAAKSHITGEQGAYYYAAGTSFAAPFVAGAASLLKALRREQPPEVIARMLVQSTDDVMGPGKDLRSGYGRLNIAAALKADPEFFIESDITGVVGVRHKGKPAVEVRGTADADVFSGAAVEIRPTTGADSSWRNVERLGKPVSDGVLAVVPATELKGAQGWQIRLVVQHAQGREREAHFELNLN